MSRESKKSGFRFNAVSVLLALLCIAANAFAIPTVVDVEPKGLVRNVRQISMQFGDDMVAMGDDRAAMPAEVNCLGTDQTPKGHWLDGKRWVAEFATPLPDGVSCSIRPVVSKSLSGANLQSPEPWTFNTGGPRIQNHSELRARDGRILEQPIFAILPSTKVDLASLRNLECSVDGSTVLTTLLDGDAKEKARQQLFSTKPVDWADWLIFRCGVADWPANAKINILWSKKIKSAIGLTNAADESINFQVRENFTGQLICPQLPATPGCDPRSANGIITLQFSAYLGADQYDKPTLHGSSGENYTASPTPYSLRQSGWLNFTGDFSAEKFLTVDLPENFSDVSHRPISNRAELSAPYPLAILPAYVGVPEKQGLETWRPGQIAHWPIITRNTEASLQVHTWHFSLSDTSSETLLKLHQFTYDYADKFWLADDKYQTPFAASSALLKSVPDAQREPAVSSITPESAKLGFTQLPLKGYGSWLIEVDSPAYRVAFEAQLRAVLQTAQAQNDAHEFNSNPTDVVALRNTVIHSWISSRVALVQLTNLRLVGHLSQYGDGMVWLTAFDTGLPVPGATIELWSDQLNKHMTIQSDQKGVAIIPHSSADYFIGGGWIVASSGDDRVVSRARQLFINDSSRLVVHQVLDRPAYHAGETVSIQAIGREPDSDGWRFPNADDSATLVISDEKNNRVFEKKLDWRQSGSAEINWQIPATARLGWYSSRIEMNGRRYGANVQFMIGEFRQPVFDAGITSTSSWSNGDTSVHLIEYQPRLSFFSSGPAGGQDIVLKRAATLYPQAPLADYTFYQRFYMQNSAPPVPNFADLPFKLDKNGKKKINVDAPLFDEPLNIQTEMQFSDPNGEVQTVTTNVASWPRYKLGVRYDQPDRADRANADVILLDQDDKPVAQRDVHVSLVDSQSHESVSICDTKTGRDGKSSCQFFWNDKYNTGTWSIHAKAAEATHPVFVLFRSFFNEKINQDSRLKIELADTATPMPGQAIRLKVHSPFAPATALFVIARDGVISTHLKTLATHDEIVELPSDARFAPSVWVTADVVQPIAEPDPNSSQKTENLLSSDLKINFDKSAALLDVNVSSNQKTALPGSTVPVEIQVNRSRDHSVVGKGRITVLAVDEALLALIPNTTWDVIDTFWNWRNQNLWGFWEAAVNPKFVQNSIPHPEDVLLNFMQINQTMSAGIRRVDAMTPAPVQAMSSRGTDAYADPRVFVTGSAIRKQDLYGDEAPRTNFATRAYWKTDIELDQNGRAHVDIPLPDSLTKWRIVVIASSGVDEFGTGETNVQASKPVELISGLPQTVRGGDVIEQRLSLHNTERHAIEAVLQATATNGTTTLSSLRMRKVVKVNPSAVVPVSWKIKVPDGIENLAWTFEATSLQGKKFDALQITQKVFAAYPVSVREATLVHIDQPKSIPLAQPSEALPGSSTVRVLWKDSLVNAALTGTQAWMRDYPFNCMEQLTSKAVVSGDDDAWQTLMLKLPDMIDTNGLVRYFAETKGSEILTAYVLEIADAYHLTIPETEAKRMRKGLRNALQKDSERQNAQWLSKAGMLSQRLAMQAALATHPDNANPIKPTVPEDLNTLPAIGLLDWIQYLESLPDSQIRHAQLDEANQQLRSRYEMQGTRLVMRLDPNSNNGWMMWNDDVVATRSALMVSRYFSEQPRWKALIPLMLSSLVDQQHSGHWRTTVANAWGAAAMKEFSYTAEHGPVAGVSHAQFQSVGVNSIWPNPADADLTMPVSVNNAALNLTHEGTGAPWATVQIRSAIHLSKPVSHGLAVTKDIAPEQQRVPGKWTVGDVIRVTLTMHTDEDTSWLVVRDPIPSGSAILGKGTARESQLAQKNVAKNWWWFPSSEERGNESFRGYYEHVWAGEWKASYTLRLNNAGTFVLPATRIEAMYAPDIFGEVPNAVLTVNP